MTTRETLRDLYEVLLAASKRPSTALAKGARSAQGKVDVYSRLAVSLARMIGHSPWTWRYVQSVLAGTEKPSPDFVRAVELLAGEFDGMPKEFTWAVPVTVHAQAGAVKSGALVLGKSKLCERDGCLVHFVPVVPWQKYCPRCGRK